MALPYISILVVMTVLITPYLKKDYYITDVNKHLNIVLSKESILVFLAYVIYIIFAVLKSVEPGKGSNDAYAYYLNFMNANCSIKTFFSDITTFEPGYSFIIWVIRHLTSEYKWALWFWHTLTFVLIVNFYKRAYLKNNNFFVVFLALVLLISQFNTLRMSISVSIAMHSLIAMSKKNWIKAVLIILCAISIHVSAVIMIPVFLVVFITSNRKRYKRSLVITLIILGTILTIASFGIINNLTLGTDKAVYVGESSVAWGTDAAIIVFGILCFKKFNQLKQLSEINETIIIALPVAFICIPLQMNMSIMYRMLLFFIPMIYSLIPSIIKCYSDSKINLKSTVVILISYGYMFSKVYSFLTEEIEYLNDYFISL